MCFFLQAEHNRVHIITLISHKSHTLSQITNNLPHITHILPHHTHPPTHHTHPPTSHTLTHHTLSHITQSYPPTHHTHPHTSHNHTLTHITHTLPHITGFPIPTHLTPSLTLPLAMMSGLRLYWVHTFRLGSVSFTACLRAPT